MKIWHISDTHTFHDLLEIPEGVDMVILVVIVAIQEIHIIMNLKLERLLIGLLVYLYIIKYL
jgi:hypothetical protein